MRKHNADLNCLQRGFYLTVALIPASLALYKLSAQNEDSQPYFTRLINSFDSWKNDWADRNDLHTKAIEQAARDRNLFLNSPGTRHVDLKFPEYVYNFLFTVVDWVEWMEIG